MVSMYNAIPCTMIGDVKGEYDAATDLGGELNSFTCAAPLGSRARDPSTRRCRSFGA
jgi:hypothetical protein